jgi:cell division protein FtsB
MQRSRRPLLTGIVAVLLLAWVAGDAAAQVKESLDVVSGTNSNASASQKKIEQLSGETRALLEEYRRLQDGVEYQAAYTRELEQLEQSQRAQIEELQRQISEAAITRQRIVPLMRSMADALEKFVVLDLPFHHEDRINAVLLLKQRLNQPDLTVSAKFRLLLETYQLEQGYGNSIEAWRGPLQWQGEDLSVEFLRVGRVALYFQSLDGASSGYWSMEQEQWLPLDPAFDRDIAQALRVARNLVAPELLQLPLVAPGDAS